MPGPGWPLANHTSTFEPKDTDWNAIADAPHNWPGDVNAGGNQLLAVANINGTGSLTMSGQPRAVAFNSINQSIANSTWTSLTFDSNASNVANIHSTTTNTSRFTAPQTGYYLALGQVEFAPNATGQRHIRIMFGGASVIGRHDTNAISGDITTLQVVRFLGMNVGDYIEFQVYQNSGGSLNADTGNGITIGSLVQLS